MQCRWRSSDGFALIEVIASAAILVVGVLATLSLVDGASAGSRENRLRSAAVGVAHADLERLRHMSSDDLTGGWSETRAVTDTGTRFTVTSRASWTSDNGFSASCTSDPGQAQYLTLTSTVAWPTLGTRKPVVLTTLLAPPVAALSPANGTLGLKLQTAAGAAVSGVPVTLTGAETHTATTTLQGCATFALIPGGSYTASYRADGFVSPAGDESVSAGVSVTGGIATNVSQLYDKASSADLRLVTKLTSGGSWTSVAAPQTVALETPKLASPRLFPAAADGTVTASRLFPFAEGYGAYAGSCTGNNPSRFDSDFFTTIGGNVPVTAGLSSGAIDVPIPTVRLNVVSSLLSSTRPASLKIVANTAKPAMKGCDTTPATTTTDSSGDVTTQLPFGDYTVCASIGSVKIGLPLSVSSLLPAVLSLKPTSSTAC